MAKAKEQTEVWIRWSLSEAVGFGFCFGIGMTLWFLIWLLVFRWFGGPFLKLLF